MKLIFRLYGVIFLIFSFLLDQYTKKIILSYFYYQKHEPVILNKFLNFHLVWNRGVSFGILSNFEHAKILLLIISVLVTIFLIISFLREKKLSSIINLGLIIGGALGNIYDRYKYGKVIDFIQLHYKDYYWPTFNIADSAISLGILLLLLIEKNKVK